MTRKNFNEIQNQIIDQAIEFIEQEYGEGAIYRGYSGRGMYGAKCLGIVGVGAMAFVGAMLEVCDTIEEYEAVRYIAATIGDGETDSMGYDRIIYWRALVEVEEEEE